MTKAPPSLQSLSREQAAPTSVPRPASRWLLRFALPLCIVLAALVLLAYAARDALVPAMEVDVVPVVVKAKTQASEVHEREQNDHMPRAEATIIAQAPGWIEPDPYAVTVQAMVSGVVKEILVLEGDRVEAGQVVARLIADDAELAVRLAQAELAEREAEVAMARSAIASAESRLEELLDESDRAGELVKVGGLTEGQYARLQHRLRSQESDVEAARAAARQHEAAAERQRVAVEQAELDLQRTVIRAPVDGVVLSRSVVPGTRLVTAGDGMGESHFPGVIRLYDPDRLQVRADVPLTDAAKVGLGTLARITTEALPDQTFHGEVSRIVHQADIQRNTVQVKVRIDEPAPTLKPDMLVRVRFVTGTSAEDRVASTEHMQRDTGSLRIYAPMEAIVQRDGDRGRAWVIEPDGGRTYRAVLRDLTLGGTDGDAGVLARSGLRPGDRLIVNPPPQLESGMRVRIRSARTASYHETEGH